MKPTKHVLVALFYEKHNEGAEKYRIINRGNGFTEDVKLVNKECKEELVKIFVENIREKKKRSNGKHYDKRN